MKKMILACLLLTPTLGISQVYEYQAEQSANRAGSISNGFVTFHSSDLLFVRPTRDSYTYKEVIYSKNLMQAAVERGDVSDCESETYTAGFLNFKTYYNCFKKRLFEQHVERYEATQRFQSSLSTTFEVKGFTPSMAELYAEVKSRGDIVGHFSSVGSEVSHIGTLRVTSCMDRYGREQEAFGGIRSSLNRSNLEALIDGLLDSGYEEYVLCHLRGDEFRRSSVTGTQAMHGRTMHLVPTRIQIDEASTEITVNNALYRAANEAEHFDGVEGLNQAIMDYVDFIKFEYGIVLADIARDQLSEAEARLKINRFLAGNREKIRGLLAEVNQAMEKAPLFTKVAAGFKVSQVYGYIREIEKSLNSQLTLDRIIR